MALIDVTTFGDGDDKYLEIVNEEYGRKLQIADNWTVLRIGAMLNIVPDSTNDLAGSHLRFGISTDRDDHIGSLTADLWYGIGFGTQSINLTGASLIYNAGAGTPYFAATSGTARLKALVGVLSGTGTAGTYALPTTTGSTLRRWPLVVRFEKSGTDLIVNFWGMNVNTLVASDDFTQNEFIDMFDSPDLAPTIGGFSLTSGGSTTFANYPTDATAQGEVIAIQLGWNKVSTPLRIYAVGAARFA